MSFLAPRVFALAVVADLRYTTKANDTRDWDLPDTLKPAAIGNLQPGLPTVNLLGWIRSTTLTPDQRTHIEDTGVSADGFGERRRFCLNTMVIEKVHDALNNSSAKVKLGTGLCDRPTGSIGQIIQYERNLDEEPEFSRIQYYLESEIRGITPQQLDRRIAMYGQVFSFRVEKDFIRAANTGPKFFPISRGTQWGTQVLENTMFPPATDIFQLTNGNGNIFTPLFH